MRDSIKVVPKLTVLLGVRHSHRGLSPYHIHHPFRQNRSWYLLRYRKSLFTFSSMQPGYSHSYTNHVYLNTAFPRDGNDRRSSRLYCHDLPRSVQHNHRSDALDFASACEVRPFVSATDEGDTKIKSCRAVDNEIYVAMCSPARHPEAAYQAVRVLFTLFAVSFDLVSDILRQYGHSSVVNPV